MIRRRLLDLDRRVSQFMRVAEPPGPLHVTAAILAHSGDSWFWGIGLGLLWVVNPAGSSAPAAGWRPWSVGVFLNILGLALVVLAIKFLIRRRRPEGDWGALYRKADPHSFPSGHAARAALILVLVSVWGPPWLRPILFLWTPAMALSRVALGLHYVSDVVGGILLGVALASLSLAFF